MVRLSSTEVVGTSKLWKGFLSSIEVDYDNQLLQQSVNQKVFEIILPEQFPSLTDHSPRVQEPLSKDELNALQYACGYIPHALLKRYEKRTGSKFDKFTDCLGDVAVHSECDSGNFSTHPVCSPKLWTCDVMGFLNTHLYIVVGLSDLEVNLLFLRHHFYFLY